MHVRRYCAYFTYTYIYSNMQSTCRRTFELLTHTHTHTHTANKKPATEHAAVWVPDSDASTCMHCLKTKFTPINRRVSC